VNEEALTHGGEGEEEEEEGGCRAKRNQKVNIKFVFT